MAHPDEGVRRTFHDAGLTVALGFLDGWGSPVEVEAPTLEEVRFHPRGEWTSIKVGDVPARVFSEVMRDLDLVVSVAHAGGVDPEATASTIEMRAALVEETCGLLKIENVRVDKRWALVDGHLGEVFCPSRQRRCSPAAGRLGLHRAGARPASRQGLPALR